MDTHPYYGPGNVVIDSCDRCELVWLDFGELKQIVDAPGQDRGTRANRFRARGTPGNTHRWSRVSGIGGRPSIRSISLT